MPKQPRPRGKSPVSAPATAPAKASRRAPPAGHQDFEDHPLVRARRSKIHGNGVFAIAPIRKGQRIMEYIGEHITHAEADLRFQAKAEDDGHTFLFILNNRTVIDATNFGNDARYINHSCNPNCETVIDGRRVFIEATRDIEPGDELGYEYQLTWESTDDPEDLAVYACRCGAANCRGTMLAEVAVDVQRKKDREKARRRKEREARAAGEAVAPAPTRSKTKAKSKAKAKAKSKAKVKAKSKAKAKTKARTTPATARTGAAAKTVTRASGKQVRSKAKAKTKVARTKAKSGARTPAKTSVTRARGKVAAASKTAARNKATGKSSARSKSKAKVKRSARG